MDRPNNFRGHVLIVDDNALNLKLAEAVLLADGFQIECMTTGIGVFEWVQQHRPDLVLLDIMMPGVDGLEVCRQLNASTATAQVPVILLTAKSGRENQAEGFKAGCADYLTKPVDADELVARVRVHVENQQLQRRLSSSLEEVRAKNQDLQLSLDHIAKLKGALLRVCAWTKRINVNDEWIAIDRYLSEHLGIPLTHGISEEALNEMLQSELPLRRND